MSLWPARSIRQLRRDGDRPAERPLSQVKPLLAGDPAKEDLTSPPRPKIALEQRRGGRVPPSPKRRVAKIRQSAYRSAEPHLACSVQSARWRDSGAPQ